MKATKYIAVIALLMGLVSCQPESFNGESVDADTVALTFSVQFPEPILIETKGTMGEGPLLSEAFDIHLCLYGPGDGYVQNWITATPVGTPTTTTIGDNTYITGGQFQVFLPITDEKRTIHIIANPPDAVNPTTDDYLDNVMEKMVNGKNDDGKYECSYWQEIILENGIHAGAGDPHSSGLPYADATVTGAFQGIQLLRNFAKLIVEGPTATEEAFELKQWALINFPKKGYVAPYTGNKEKRFPYGYSTAFLSTPNLTADALYTQLTEVDGYKGYMPNDENGIIDKSFPGEPGTAPEGTYLTSGQAKYLYERPRPTSTDVQTAILIQIEFKEGHRCYDEAHPDSEHNTWWYKVEVLNNEGDYFPVLRNFVYKLHILGLEQTGEETAEDAFNGAYFGNISASLETAGLSDLSNGESAIHVDVLDYAFWTIPENNKILLMKGEAAALFYFTPDVNNPTDIYWEDATGVTVNVSIVAVEGYPAAISDVVVSDGGAGGLLTVTTTGLPTTGLKKSIVRVKGKKQGGKELYRDIMITLMQKPTFTHVDGTTSVSTPTAVISDHGVDDISGINKPVELRICLPEGLGSSVFPVQVRIEAENNALSATSPNLPVQTGKSVFNTNRNTFFYIFTINYSDYCYLDSRTKKYVYKYQFGIGQTEKDHIILYTNKTGDNSTKIDIRDMAGNFVGQVLTIGSATNP